MSNPAIPRSEGTVTMDRVTTALVLVHHIIVFLWVLRKNSKELEMPRGNNFRRKLFTITAYFLMFHILLQATQLVYTLGVSCTVVGLISGTFSFLARGTFWFYNVYRMDSAFSRISYEYGCCSQFYNWARLVLGLVFLVQISLAVTGLSFTSEYLPEYGYCLVHPTELAYFTFAFDLVINLTIALLFAYNTWRIVRMGRDQGLRYAARKGLVLNVCVIIAVMINVALLNISDVLFFSSFEKIAVVWCLIQFDDRLDGIYNKICCCCVVGEKPERVVTMVELGQGNGQDVEDPTAAMRETIPTHEPAPSEEPTA